jgi:GNAT superfamily N-acetyltransferase
VPVDGSISRWTSAPEPRSVAPDHRHCGVGAAFLGQAEQIAKSAGLDEVRLFTNETMTENLAYDPTKGYTESHRSIDRGYRRVWFVKHLDPDK